MTTSPSITCGRCGAAPKSKPKPSKDGGWKLPRGWKQWSGEHWCDRCWRSGWVTRAVTLPIAWARVEGGGRIEMADLRRLIRESCYLASAAANMVIRECVAVDVVRLPGQDRMPPMPAYPPGPTGKASTYVYHRIRAALPDLDPSSVTSICQSAERKWRASRLDVVWRRTAAPPSFRADMPCPIAGAATRIWSDAEGRVVVSIRIGGQRIECVMVQGAEWRRQLAALRHVADGEWMGGECAVYLRDGRPTMKVAYSAPVTSSREAQGTLTVRTTGEHLVTMVAGATVRHFNADRFRRMFATHDIRLRRWSEDAKPETRPPAMVLSHMSEDRERACRARARVVDTLTHTVASVVVGFARRRRLARIAYDDSDRSYLSASFPWHTLAERIGQKAHAYGIEYEMIAPDASATVVAPRQESLEDEVRQ